jgi:hypothetical protein
MATAVEGSRVLEHWSSWVNSAHATTSCLYCYGLGGGSDSAIKAMLWDTEVDES